MPSQSLRSDAVDVVRTVSFPLLLVATAIGLLLMPDLVGADWPGYNSAMILVVLVALPATFTLTLLSLNPSRVARWITVLAIGACVTRAVWSLYDAGERATFAAIALSPFLLLLVIAIGLLAYSWPKATTRELTEAARRHGWLVFRELPDGRRAARPAISGVHGEVPSSSPIQPGVHASGMLTVPSTPLPSGAVRSCATSYLLTTASPSKCAGWSGTAWCAVDDDSRCSSDGPWSGRCRRSRSAPDVG